MTIQPCAYQRWVRLKGPPHLWKEPQMYLLGIAGQVQDAAAALIKDGEIVAAAEEERFSRLKFMGILQSGDSLPSRSIRYCLNKAGITLDEVDHICYFYRPFHELCGRLLFDAKRGLKSPKTGLFYMFQKLEIFKAHMKTLALLRRSQRKPSTIHHLEHHRCHAASCYFLSGLEESAVLVMDAIGENASTTWFHAVGNKMKRLKTIDYPHSLGMVYAEVTRFCGFTPWSDEYKLMGLAAFGEPTYLDTFRDIIQLRPHGEYRLNLDYFNHALTGPELLGPRFFKTFGHPRKPGQEMTAHYINIATSLQRRLEEVAFGMAEELYRRTRTTNLCLSGGVALNCSMNGKFYAHSPFKKLVIHNASGDAGTALGAALYVWHSVLGNPIKKDIPNHAYLGPSFTNERILAALTAAKCNSFGKYDEEELCEETAKQIVNGRIVGWFQGGMEWGPRALGARSILADARNPEMKNILNKWVKHREEFRPFAPAVMEEHAHEYFECNGASPYMTVAYKVRPDKRAVIPAVTHVDGTARVQTVSERDHPRYYRLLRKFKEITGVPIVVNTSFNVMGEPIVCTPEDAIRCFYGTGIDVLVIGDYVVTKTP